MTRWGEESGVEQDPGASQKQEGRLGGVSWKLQGKTSKQLPIFWPEGQTSGIKK